MTPRLPLIHGPTPIERIPALDDLIGCRVHVKRDDCTGSVEGGNKLRKLEYFLADAKAKGATTLLTCGALQSNHARATAIMAARHGLRSLLLLRVGAETGLPTNAYEDAPAAEPHQAGRPNAAAEPHQAGRPNAAAEPHQAGRPNTVGVLPATGNVALDRLVGARIRLISPADYEQRAALMLELSLSPEDGEAIYVIPEGGSNGLGALGYVRAAEEIDWQTKSGVTDTTHFSEVVVACGSGGTAAGLALGAARTQVYERVRAALVCDNAAYFEGVVRRICVEARAYDETLGTVVAPVLYDGAGRGPRYGVMDTAQRAFLRDVARRTGILLDPVYTGKAMYALRLARERRDVGPKDDILFVHTGGAFGLVAEAETLLAD